MATQLEEFVRQSIDELLKELPPEKRMEGLPPEKRLEGLSPDARLVGLSTEQLHAIIEAANRRLGKNGSSHEKTEAYSGSNRRLLLEGRFQ